MSTPLPEEYTVDPVVALEKIEPRHYLPPHWTPTTPPRKTIAAKPTRPFAVEGPEVDRAAYGEAVRFYPENRLFSPWNVHEYWTMYEESALDRGRHTNQTLGCGHTVDFECQCSGAWPAMRRG